MINIFQYFRIFQTEKNFPLHEQELFRWVNDISKSAIPSVSWCLYVLGILLIASILSYLYNERKKRRTNQERMREIQQLIERPPPKRRPGAVARDREVFRNVLKSAHSYIYPSDETKKCVIRQTRSGTIYGKFMDTKGNEIESKHQ